MYCTSNKKNGLKGSLIDLGEAFSQPSVHDTVGLDGIQYGRLFGRETAIGRQAKRGVHRLVSQVQVERFLIERGLLLENLSARSGKEGAKESLGILTSITTPTCNRRA